MRETSLRTPGAMSVFSTGPLRASSRVWTPTPGRWALTVVCKATYRLVAGEAPLDTEQEDPNEEDNYWDDDPQRSLYSPCDLVPFKQRADVVLVGHAFAPGGQPARSIRTRLVVGDVDKVIEAFCDRSFTREGQLREGAPVAKVSLRYERAAGGPMTSNPAGVPAYRADAYGSIPLPNLQAPGLHIASRGDVIEPIGYGPLAPTWPSRTDKLGGLRGYWDASRWHEAPLPEGFDPAFFNVAPADQQVSALRDQERIVLENLHPSIPRLVTNLCGARPAATVERAGHPPELLAMLPDTLWIDSSRRVCTLVFRGLIHLNHRDEPGRVVVATELAPRRAAPSDPDSAETAPLRPDWSRRRPVMPFQASGAAPVAAADPSLPAAPDRTIEECAAIAASLARRRADAANILKEHKLLERDYVALDKHWAEEIRDETSRGKTALLRAYDEAYVAQLERERGPILVDEYARLAVASERGRAADVLSELSLPRGALVRIERVWVTKLADDPELAAKARKAIEAARQA